MAKNQTSNKKPFFIVGGIFLVALFAALWSWMPNRSTEPVSESPKPVARRLTKPQVIPKPVETKETKTDPYASLAKIRQTFGNLEDLFIELKQLKELMEGPDGKKFRGVEDELKRRIKQFRREARRMVRDSELAQEELFALIESSDDPFVNKKMVELYREADSDIRVKYYEKLVETRSVENQSLGVKMMAGVTTEGALNGLVSVAENREVTPEVRRKAVTGLAKNMELAYGDMRHQASTLAAIRQFTEPAYEPEIRETAFRTFVMRTEFSEEDEKFISESLEGETDVKVQRAAWFAQKVIEARQRSASRQVSGN